MPGKDPTAQTQTQAAPQTSAVSMAGNGKGGRTIDQSLYTPSYSPGGQGASRYLSGFAPTDYSTNMFAPNQSPVKPSAPYNFPQTPITPQSVAAANAKAAQEAKEMEEISRMLMGQWPSSE